MLLEKKKDKDPKGRCVYNGKPTRIYKKREDTTSPTVSLEANLITALIDAHEKRNVMSNDVPNGFVQTRLKTRVEGDEDKHKERINMKIKGR